MIGGFAMMDEDITLTFQREGDRQSRAGSSAQTMYIFDEHTCLKNACIYYIYIYIYIYICIIIFVPMKSTKVGNEHWGEGGGDYLHLH